MLIEKIASAFIDIIPNTNKETRNQTIVNQNNTNFTKPYKLGSRNLFAGNFACSFNRIGDVTTSGEYVIIHQIII